MPVVAETQALQGLMAGLVALGLAASGWVAGGCTRQEVQEAGVETCKHDDNAQPEETTLLT